MITNMIFNFAQENVIKSDENRISFILPTYNASEYLDKCLESIQTLKYPKTSIEIVAADGGSSDDTIKILNKHNVKIMRNAKRIAEYGKYIAFKESTGKYIVFIDADNVIADDNWLQKMIKPLKDDESILGVESNYLIADDFSSFNTYISLLIIADPYARLLSAKPQTIHNSDNYLVKEFAKGSAPVSGANGFIWRRSALEPYAENTDTLEEATILQRIAQNSSVKIGNIPNIGIYHYYCKNLIDFIGKRRKIAGKYLQRSANSETWVEKQNSAYRILGALYLLTIIGPMIETGIKYNKSKRIEWLWHPIACCTTMLVYAYYLVKSKLGDSTTNS